MSESRVRIKFGEHEFESEGPPDHVERQFETFRRMAAPDPMVPAPVEAPPKPVPVVAVDVKPPLSLTKIMRAKARVVSLSVNAKIDEAVLAILLGQRHFRQNNSVSGMEIMSGLRDSGLDVPRADTILAKHARDGIVVVAGRRKMRRYRLSTDGIARAEQIASQLISKTP